MYNLPVSLYPVYTWYKPRQAKLSSLDNPLNGYQIPDVLSYLSTGRLNQLEIRSGLFAGSQPGTQPSRPVGSGKLRLSRNQPFRLPCQTGVRVRQWHTCPPGAIQPTTQTMAAPLCQFLE